MWHEIFKVLRIIKPQNLSTMKRFSLLLITLCLALSVVAQGKAKYVFYFIGDGMGVDYNRQYRNTKDYKMNNYMAIK